MVFLNKRILKISPSQAVSICLVAIASGAVSTGASELNSSRLRCSQLQAFDPGELFVLAREPDSEDSARISRYESGVADTNSLVGLSYGAFGKPEKEIEVLSSVISRSVPKDGALCFPCGDHNAILELAETFIRVGNLDSAHKYARIVGEAIEKTGRVMRPTEDFHARSLRISSYLLFKKNCIDDAISLLLPSFDRIQNRRFVIYLLNKRYPRDSIRAEMERATKNIKIEKNPCPMCYGMYPKMAFVKIFGIRLALDHPFKVGRSGPTKSDFLQTFKRSEFYAEAICE